MPWEYRFARHQGLAVYIQSDIIELIRSSACETFPRARATDAGYHLKVQRDDQPDDFKPMPSIGKGVEEIRVLEWTSKKDLEIAKRRSGQLSGGRA